MLFLLLWDSHVRWFAVLQKGPVVLPVSTLACPFLNTQKNHSKGKNKNEQTDEFGADQLGACIHINISTPGKHHSHSHPISNPLCACVCFSLTTSGCVYNNSYEPRCLLFLSPAPLHQLSVAWSTWLPVWLAACFWLAGLACLSARVCCFACSAQTVRVRMSLHKSGMRWTM